MDKCSWEDEKPRIYNSLSESNSTVSLTHISKKVRRGSFFLYWDPALDITPRLARMEKSRLCLSQNQFSALEYQLYSSRCLKVKTDSSRQGTPIHMLQKVMINVIFSVIIVAGGGMAWIMVCLTGDQV